MGLARDIQTRNGLEAEVAGKGVRWLGMVYLIDDLASYQSANGSVE